MRNWEKVLATSLRNFWLAGAVRIGMMTEPLIRNISDTARWAAFYRAMESKRPDAVFRDPFAGKLAGERGEQIAQAMHFSTKNAWSWIARTYLFDRFILEGIQNGCDMVINLAAGLDARPYRLELPKTLQWIEVDLPGILQYKEEILATDSPKCKLERIPLDLAKVEERRDLFAQLGKRAKNVLLLTEGLIIYFTQEDVEVFTRDLAGPDSFRYWILDLASPGLLKMLKENMGEQMGKDAVLKFGPEAGPAFFKPFGWNAMQVYSTLKTAGRIKRLPFLFKLFAPLTPEVFKPGKGKQPWGGVCLMQRLMT